MSLTAEQLKIRKNGIGASESPCIVGLSPHGGPISVWASKMNLNIEEPETDAQKLGNFLEQGIADFYAAENNVKLRNVGTIFHKRHPWMLATPDRRVVGERKLLQIKLVGTWMMHHWEDGVPPYIEVQCQHEMEVADVDACDLAAVLGGTEVRIVTLERDREVGANLVEICGDFWNRYVVTGEMPPADGSEEADAAIRARLRILRPEPIMADDVAERWGRACLDAMERKKSATVDEKIAKQNLQALMGEHLVMEGQDFRASWSKENEKGGRSFTVKPANEKAKRAA